MKHFTKTILSISIVLCFSIPGIAQEQFDVWFGKNVRNDYGLAYNFFVGDDAEDFTTTINGFGSGFFDIFTGRMSFDLITIGWKSFNVSLGAGVGISKYRFSENIVLEKTTHQVVYYYDDNPEHDYGNGFFSYGKSKLIVGSFYVPVNLNISLGELHFSAGGFVDQYLSGKHKRKFKVGDDKEKVMIRNDEFNDSYLNKLKYGVKALIFHKKSGFGMGFTYLLTPFFEEDKGPDLNEARISFSYDFSIFEKD